MTSPYTPEAKRPNPFCRNLLTLAGNTISTGHNAPTYGHYPQEGRSKSHQTIPAPLFYLGTPLAGLLSDRVAHVPVHPRRPRPPPGIVRVDGDPGTRHMRSRRLHRHDVAVIRRRGHPDPTRTSKAPLRTGRRRLMSDQPPVLPAPAVGGHTVSMFPVRHPRPARLLPS